MVNWACHLTEADLEVIRYQLSDPEKEVPLMDFNTCVKATNPISDYCTKKFYNKPYCDIN